MPIYNDTINAAARKLVTDIRDLVDVAFNYIEGDVDLTNEEKACIMMEIHNNYTRNNTLLREMMKLYKTAAEEPEE